MLVAFKMACRDKSCCLGYNCADSWVGIQRECWVRKFVGSVKIVFGKCLPQLSWLLLNWLIEISHVALIKFVPQLA